MMDAAATARVLSLTRPHKNLLKLYVLQSLLLGPLFPFALVPLLFRYSTLRYVFDEEGVSMRWGVFFRREVSLNYARIQDIHLSNHLLERWLGLARVQVQTASGSASAEMTIEGLQEFELVRDFLYTRMRGAKGLADLDEVPASSALATEEGATRSAEAPPGGDLGRLVATLEAVTVELRAIRTHLEGQRVQVGPPPEQRRESP